METVENTNNTPLTYERMLGADFIFCCYCQNYYLNKNKQQYDCKHFQDRFMANENQKCEQYKPNKTYHLDLALLLGVPSLNPDDFIEYKRIICKLKKHLNSCEGR